MAVWWPAYIGVGSNIDDPAAQVAKAIEKLRALSAVPPPREPAAAGVMSLTAASAPDATADSSVAKRPKTSAPTPVAPNTPATQVVLISPLYGSKPLGSISQPDFVNGVVGILTQLDALALLNALRAIESALGRPERHEKWGPRVIDLDLLVYAHEQRTDPELTLPHPGIVNRNFVLYPLADIAPDLDVPGLGRVAELKERVAPTGLWPLPLRAPVTA